MSRRKEQHEKEPNHERWLVSYADFITLLFATFVVLYAMSQVDQAKVAKVIASSNEAFGVATSSSAPVFNVIDSDSVNPIPMPDSLKQKMTTPETLIKQQSNKQERPGIKGEKSKAGLQEFKKIKQDIIAFLETKGAKDKVKLEIGPRGLVISLKDSEFFDSGKATIRSESMNLLNAISLALDNYSNLIRIEGHTDNIPIKTSLFPSNWELSTARATNIVQYLISTHALTPERLSAIGYGEYRPNADNATEEGRQKNRRVDMVLLSSDGEQGEPTSQVITDQPVPL